MSLSTGMDGNSLAICFCLPCGGHFQGIGGLFVRCLLSGVGTNVGDEGKQREREQKYVPSRAASSARMSPTGLSLSMVACPQSPLPFHPVSLFRSSARAEHSCICPSVPQHSNGSSLRGKGKTYWPACWRISPCSTAWVMANCAVRFEHWLRCIISWRNWL